MRRNPRRAVGVINPKIEADAALPASTRRKRQPPVKKTTAQQTDLDLDTSSTTDPTIAEIDEEANHISPEEAWFGIKSRKRTAPSQRVGDRADKFNTGAFAVWGPASDELPLKCRRYATDSPHLEKFVNKEGERRSEAFRKFAQLTRHGLVRSQQPRPKRQSWRGFATQQALLNMMATREEDSRQTRNFQRAMKNPQHPDFGMSFVNAVDLAIAEKKVARHMVAQEDSWGSNDNESEASTIVVPTTKQQKRAGLAPLAKPSSQTSHSSDSETSTDPRLTRNEYSLARASGFDFHDTNLVDMFSKVLRQDDPSRPIRSQASLLEVCRMGAEEYFDEKLAIVPGYVSHLGKAEHASG
jgi:hypothetical protein